MQKLGHLTQIEEAEEALFFLFERNRWFAYGLKVKHDRYYRKTASSDGYLFHFGKYSMRKENQTQYKFPHCRLIQMRIITPSVNFLFIPVCLKLFLHAIRDLSSLQTDIANYYRLCMYLLIAVYNKSVSTSVYLSRRYMRL